MQPTTTPAKPRPSKKKKMTLQQRIALQGLATRCRADQTFRQCVEEVAGWLGIRSTRTEVMLETGLRKLFGTDHAADSGRACELFLSQIAAQPQLAKKFSVDAMSFDEKFRALRVEAREHLIVLSQLSIPPTKFLDGVQRVAHATDRSADIIRETMALGLTIFFPNLNSLDDRISAFHAVAQEKMRRRAPVAHPETETPTLESSHTTAHRDADRAPEDHKSAPDNSAEPRNRDRHAEARALQRRYDLMSDRDKARTHDLAMWTRLGGAMPVSRAEAHRLYRLLFPEMRNASQQENSLRLALKRKRLVLKDKRHQVAFLTTTDLDD